MSEVIRLKVPPQNTVMLEHFDKEVARVREWIVKYPNSGFVLASYSREGSETVHHTGGYFFNDVMDRFWLPNFLAEKIRALIVTTTVDDD